MHYSYRSSMSPSYQKLSGLMLSPFVSAISYDG